MIPFPVPGDAEFRRTPGSGAPAARSSELDGDTWTVGSRERRVAGKGIQFWTDLATKYGFSSSGATTWKETDVLDNFVQGKVAMAIIGLLDPGDDHRGEPGARGQVRRHPDPR